MYDPTLISDIARVLSAVVGWIVIILVLIRVVRL